MTALAQLDLPCPPATDGEIAAINLESARRRAWARFEQDARAPGIADVSAARVFDARYCTRVETRMETDMLRDIADLVMIGTRCCRRALSARRFANVADPVKVEKSGFGGSVSTELTRRRTTHVRWYSSTQIRLDFVSELCHIPPETLGQHRNLRGDAEADRCCRKSLIGSGVGAFR
jgi:hypothetical protein